MTGHVLLFSVWCHLVATLSTTHAPVFDNNLAGTHVQFWRTYKVRVSPQRSPSQYETLQQPPQEAAALCAKGGFDDVDDQGEEEDAGGQIVQEV